MPAKEHHKIFRAGWLRAAVLGTNDGIVSTASLMTGVAAAQSDFHSIITSGLSGLFAGALSMAIGEYVSVCSQADTEKAELKLEQSSLNKNSEAELKELIQIYRDRGLSKNLAEKVAMHLTQHNALDAHARDELGISMHNRAKPFQAAMISAISFSIGALVPLTVAFIIPIAQLIFSVILTSIVSLGLLGAIAAYTGGAPIIPAIFRVTILGASAMAIMNFIGKFFGVTM